MQVAAGRQHRGACAPDRRPAPGAGSRRRARAGWPDLAVVGSTHCCGSSQQRARRRAHAAASGPPRRRRRWRSDAQCVLSSAAAWQESAIAASKSARSPARRRAHDVQSVRNQRVFEFQHRCAEPAIAVGAVAQAGSAGQVDRRRLRLDQRRPSPRAARRSSGAQARQRSSELSGRRRPRYRPALVTGGVR